MPGLDLIKNALPESARVPLAILAAISVGAVAALGLRTWIDGEARAVARQEVAQALTPQVRQEITVVATDAAMRAVLEALRPVAVELASHEARDDQRHVTIVEWQQGAEARLSSCCPYVRPRL